MDMIGLDRELEIFSVDLEEWAIIKELCRVLKVIIFVKFYIVFFSKLNLIMKNLFRFFTMQLYTCQNQILLHFHRQFLYTMLY